MCPAEQYNLSTTTVLTLQAPKPRYAMAAPPKRLGGETTEARWTANALFGRLGAPVQSAAVTGGALHVNEANGVLVLTEGDIILALSSAKLTANEVVTAYRSTAAHSDTRARVSALRSELGALGSKDAFAFVLFDAAMGRVCAARTANSDPLSYGFAADGTLVAASGLTAADFFPEGGEAALELTALPSGRFIFGHRYVKPIEFTQFWSTARTNRASVPARKAVESEADICTPVVNYPKPLPRRWGATGTRADSISSWRGATADDVKVVSAKPKSRLADPAAMDVATASLPLPTASKTAYVPPAMRKAAAEAAAKAKAAEEEAAAEEAAAKKSAGALSPRTAQSNADSQLASQLDLGEDVVSGLGSALASAFFKSAPPGAFAGTGTVTKPRLSLEIPNAGQVQNHGLFTAPARACKVDRLRSRTFTLGSVSAKAVPGVWDEVHAGLKTAREAGARASVRRSMESCARSSLDFGSRRTSMSAVLMNSCN